MVYGFLPIPNPNPVASLRVLSPPTHMGNTLRDARGFGIRNHGDNPNPNMCSYRYFKK
jgi:hypothetical protein